MRSFDGMRIIGPESPWESGPASTFRELVSDAETGGRWRLGEVRAQPDDGVATHLHPGEPEALIVLEGPVELHGAQGVTTLQVGDIVFVPPDTEHGLRTPSGGRWLAIWPTRERVPGNRYRASA